LYAKIQGFYQAKESVRGFMRIVLLSDTHGFLDNALIASCRDCDEIWHAGDFGTAEVLDRLEEIATVRGVFGNVDGAELRSQVPEDLG
ncbi:metallophosphoesterase family protein, partial [Salmonella sp. SAL4443]|uniref:metallophosphoesterase family protein n=1 Tax=Salmonella sp. SAL4443 TaxID=3159898 RepID=UPI003979C2C4